MTLAPDPFWTVRLEQITMSLSTTLAGVAFAAAFAVPASVFGQTAPAPTMNSIVAQAIMTPPTPVAPEPVNPHVGEVASAPMNADAAATPGAVMLAPILVTNGPIPDNAENRAKYGQPMSRAGRATSAKGN